MARSLARAADPSCQDSVPAGLSGVVAIAAGAIFGLALTSSGRVVAWGDNTYGQTDVPTGLSNVVAIAVGRGHALALRSNGQVVGVGTTVTVNSTFPPGWRTWSQSTSATTTTWR